MNGKEKKKIKLFDRKGSQWILLFKRKIIITFYVKFGIGVTLAFIDGFGNKINVSRYVGLNSNLVDILMWLAFGVVFAFSGFFPNMLVFSFLDNVQVIREQLEGTKE